MAGRSLTGKPQVVDEAFVDDMVRDLQVVGTMGVLDVADGIVPVYLLGQRTAFKVEIEEPSFKFTELFTEGFQGSAPAATLMAETGQLPVGIYDFWVHFGGASAVATGRYVLRWLDAALAEKIIWTPDAGQEYGGSHSLKFALELATGEGIEVETLATVTNSSVVIAARLRA